MAQQTPTSGISFDPVLDRSPSAELLAQLDARCFADPWDARALTTLLANPVHRAWMLSAGGTAGGPVAFVLYQILADEAEILRIGVVPEARGQGLGQFLLKALLKELGQVSGMKVFLEVRAGNLPARKLYQACGFQEASVRTGYYRNPPEDAIQFQWRESRRTSASELG